MLEYENEMFLSAVQEDGLTIVAKGLGLENVFTNLLKAYADPGNLVLVLGCSEAEEIYFRGQLESKGCTCLPKKITTDISTKERENVYKEGGILHITTRILVVDFLMERIPANLITGIVVYRAHRIIDSCQESFILRLYRQKNKEGFIKAFSASPVSFSAGFCKVERVMKNLFVKHLHLWPRFHKTVSLSLAKSQPEVVELHLEMTHKMKAIQTAVLELISFTVKEVKRLNPHLPTDQLTVENTISKSFHKILQQELNPIWHQLSGKTKQLVADLKTLRNLMIYLTQYDCITFYSLVTALRTAESAIKSSTGWVFLDSAETLFITAKERVFAAIEASAPKKKKKDGIEGHGIEENPKWNIISEILSEIREEMSELMVVEEDNVDAGDQEQEDRGEMEEVALIITKDERTGNQIRDYLELGSQRLLARMYNKALGEKHGRIEGFNDQQPPVENKNKGIGKSSTRVKEKDAEKKEFEKGMRGLRTEVYGLESSSHLQNWTLLQDLAPRYIILYDADVSFVRQIEVFQANHPKLHIRVYFVMYKGSIEEQAYLTVLKREKEAFEKLIAEKSSMVVPEDREGRTGDNQNLTRDGSKASDVMMEGRNARSRKGGGAINLHVNARVIVDMREFRSELPSLLHKRGIDIDPITIEVGDYILTPDICVERKSISDLIGSLNNGRLYNQATAMVRYYAKPMLLIEFDDKKPFSLQGKYYLSKDLQSSDIVAKLQLLTLHFPKLRVLWSPSPHATAELFDELKQGREQPDPAVATAIGVSNIDEFNVDKYNPQVKSFLSKLPGITGKNVFALLNHCENLLDLIEMPEEKLTELLESSVAGGQLYRALHSTIQVPEDASNQKPSKPPVFKSKFKSRQKRT